MYGLLVGISSILAILYCVFINASQFILRQKSRVNRSTLLSRSAQNLTHAAIVTISFVPIFLFLSCFVPSIQLSSNQTYCLCQLWFICAVLSYSIGVYMVKATYFINMLLVESRLTNNVKRIKVIVGFANIGISGLVIIILQPLILDATCHPSGMGCIISIPSYNGFVGCICVFIDAIIYCALLKDFVSLAKDEGIRVQMLVENDSREDIQLSNTDEESHTNNKSSPKQPTVKLVSQATAELDSTVNSNKTTVTTAKQEQLVRLSLFKDLAYHFMATMIALLVTILDLFVNVLMQDYGYLTLTAIDCCLMVTANFLGFRAARTYLKKVFNNIDTFLFNCLLRKQATTNKIILEQNENQSSSDHTDTDNDNDNDNDKHKKNTNQSIKSDENRFGDEFDDL